MDNRQTIDKQKNTRESAHDWMAEGDAYYKEHQYKEALNSYTRAVEEQPQSALAWHNHAQALVMCLKYPESVISCGKALELNPKNAATWFLKSFAHGVMGQYQEALDTCTKGLEIDPSNNMVWCTKGQYLYALGRLEEALECFGTALKMSPDNEYFQAVNEKVTKWLQRDGQSQEAANRIIEFLQKGGYQDALISYKESLKVDPRSVSKAFEKDYALAHLVNPEKMIKDFEKTRVTDQPQLTLELAQKEFEFSRETWVEVTLSNRGKTSARDITLSFCSDVVIKQLDISPEMLQRMKLGDKTANLDVIPELLAGNQVKKLISLTPAKLGQVDLEVQVNYTDSWGAKQCKPTVCWISVFKPGGQMPAVPGYKLMWRLSTSESANIYIAQRTSDSLKAVIKIPLFNPDQTALISEFLNEIKQTSKLSHPNIPRIFQCGEKPSPWIALEYLSKGSLARRIGRLSLMESLQIAVKLADALSYAKTFRIMHRCITSDNVLFDEKDNPRLINWRIGTITQKLHKNSSVIENVNAYYPPEKVTSGLGGADWLSDVYQYGVLMYEMLTGKPPFEGKEQEIINKILKENPPVPSTFNEEIDKSLDKLVMSCLVKNKNNRYQNISNMKNDLAKIIDELKNHKVGSRG
ncbi:MAG: tetratricopeptide repeat protein [Dehalococcoidales bacterium]|nr:tetratricopeptide repeat protein [Dehalococcoidales bacterium]